MVTIQRLHRSAILLAALLIATTPGLAADTAEWAHPLPLGEPLTAVAFADDQLGWAVGLDGVVLRTVDGGTTWSLVPQTWQVLPDLFDVLPLDTGTVLAVGAGAGVQRSIDGGLTWNAVAAPHQDRLIDLAAVGGRVVAVGDGGAAAVSIDQGLTWAALASPGDGFLNDQHWFDVDNGLVVAGAFPLFDGFAARTRDGGLSWQTVPALDTWALHDVSFVNAQTGFMIGDFTAYRSDDGGETWTDIGMVFPPYAHDLTTSSAGNWLVAAFGEGAEVHRSEDQGGTWERAFDNIELFGVADLAVLPGGRIVAVLASGAVITSDDDGASWNGRLHDLTNLGGNTMVRVEMLPDGRGLAVGNRSTFQEETAWFETSDGGRSWSVGTPPPGWQGFDDVAFATAEVVYVAGFGTESDARLARSLDGGQTWAFLSLPTEAGPIQFATPDPGVVLLLAQNPDGSFSVWRSDDQGDTWQERSAGLSPVSNYNAIDFLSADVGYATGGFATSVFYRTTDGGQSWHPRPAVGLGGYARSMSFMSADVGLVRGIEGVSRTTDGGATWQTVLEGSPWRVVELEVSGRGLALGHHEDTVALTEDGGATWRSIVLPWSGWDARSNGEFLYHAATRRGDELVVGGVFANLLHVELDVTTDASPPRPQPLSLRGAPNPFNPRTTLRFALPTSGRAQVTLHDARGRLVRRLLSGRLAAGEHAVAWDGRDDQGRAVPSGIYLARVTAAGRKSSVKLTLVR